MFKGYHSASESKLILISERMYIKVIYSTKN